jgi:hypothetical protein
MADFFVLPSDNVAPQGAVGVAENFIGITDDWQPEKWLVGEKNF